jgi:hypothetical protein
MALMFKLDGLALVLQQNWVEEGFSPAVGCLYNCGFSR